MITRSVPLIEPLNRIGYVKDARGSRANGRPREGHGAGRQSLGAVSSAWAQRSACGQTDSAGNVLHPCAYPWWSMLMLGTEPVYRLIRNHPTVALARYFVLGPVRSNTWDVTWEDERFKDHPATKWVRETFYPMRARVMRDAIRCFDYGYQPFVVAWDIVDGKYVPEVHPLLPEATTVLMDGPRFAGIENQPEKGKIDRFNDLESWVPSLDGEAGYPYGRSRYENIRDTAWSGWLDTVMRARELEQKISGIIPIVKHPPGGTEVDGTATNFRESAITALNELSVGRGVALETYPFSPEEVGDDPKLANVSLFDVDFYDATNSASAVVGFNSRLEYWDKLLFRGMLVPERAGLEAVSAGSRADSESHGDARIADSEAIDADLTESFDRNVVQTALRLNFGEEVARQVRLVSAPMLKWKQQVFSHVIDRLLSVPEFALSVARTWDLTAMADGMSIPQLKDFALDEALMKKLTAPPPAPVAPGKPPQQEPKSAVAMALASLE